MRRALTLAAASPTACPLASQLAGELGLTLDPARAALVQGADVRDNEQLLERAAAAAPSEARQLYQQAWDRGEGTGRALFGAGQAAAKLGDAVGSAKLFDRAIVEMERTLGAKMVMAEPPEVKSLRWVDEHHLMLDDWRLDLRTSVAQRAKRREPVRSPDGRWMAWFDEGVFLCAVPCTAPRQVQDGEEGGTLRFTSDSQALLVGSYGGASRFDVRGVEEPVHFAGMGLPPDVSADGRYVAIRTWKKLPRGNQYYPDRIWLLDGVTGKHIANIDDFDAGVVYLAPAGDGMALIRDGKLELIDARSGRVRARLEGSYPLAFSPDGTRLAFTSETDGLGLVDPDGTDRVILAPNGTVAFLPDSSKVALVTGGKLSLRGARSGEEIRAFDPSLGPVRHLLVSDDGSSVLVAEDEVLHLWQLGGDHYAKLDDAGASLKPVLAPDGARVAALSTRDRGKARVLVWGAEGDLQQRVSTAADTPILMSDIPSEGSRVAVWLHEGVEVWDLASGDVTRMKGSTECSRRMALSSDGASLSCLAHDRVLRWHADSGAEAPLPEERRVRVRGATGPALVARWRPGVLATLDLEGHWAFMSRDEGMIAWTTRRGVRLARADGSGATGLAWPPERRGYTMGPQCLAFSPTSDRLVATTRQGYLVEWATDGGAVLRQLSLSQGKLKQVVYAANGQRLAAAGEGGEVFVIDAASGRVLATFEHRSAYRGIGLNHDGTVIKVGHDMLRRVDGGPPVMLHGARGGGWLSTPAGIQTFGRPDATQGCEIGDYRYPLELCRGWFDTTSDLGARALAAPSR